ncbi:MAG: PucR family transcriptional regulator ligand-binding domain-containing protein [Alicyclobacillaceae bacterium]|nr:PucR family transcriptional regulator ligand-binding domain-containing protein [Alicyclobacillaceae bacterium]
MPITLREAMHTGGLRFCRVVAGRHAIDRPVSHVTVMEVPDITEWLKGDDLLLTSLYALKDDPDARRRLIRELADRGACALAVKTRRYVDAVPPEMIEEAERIGFPLLEIPRHVSYLDIMNPLMRDIVRQDEGTRRNVERDVQWLTELAFSGEGIDAVLQALASLCQKPVTFESDVSAWYGSLETREISPLPKAEKAAIKELARPTPIVRQLSGEPVSCIVAPLVLRGVLEGWLTLWQIGGQADERDFSLLERAMPLVALELMKKKTALEVEQRYKNEFLGDILTGRGEGNDEKDLIARGRLFQWDLTSDFQVAVLCPVTPENSRSPACDNMDLDTRAHVLSSLAQRAEERIRGWTDRAIVGIRAEAVVILLPLPWLAQENRSAESILWELREELLRSFPDVPIVIGIGRPYPGLGGIRTGYREALQAVRFGRDTREHPGVVHFQDLGIYRLLSQFDTEELTAFYRETIGRLEDYDRKNKTNLTETLEAFFTHNGSLTATSQTLFIHVNTLKYRLQRVEELTRLSPYDSEDRLQLQVGLKIRRLLA